MTKLPLPFAAAILLLSTMPVASALVVDEAYWATATARVEAGPGDGARPLTIVLRNDDNDDTLSDLRAELLTEDEHLTPVASASTATHPDPLGPGGSWTMRFLVDVSEDAPVGEMLEMELRVTGFSEERGEEVTRRVDVEVLLTGRALLNVSVDDVDLYADDEHDQSIEITVRNDGDGRATNVLATLSAGGTLVLPAPVVQRIGTLEPGDDASLDVPVRATRAGDGEITVELSYTSAAGVDDKASRSVVLHVADPPADGLSLTIGAANVHAGGTGDVEIVALNTDAGPIHDLVLNLEPGENLANTSAMDLRVGTLQAREERSVSVPLRSTSVEAAPGRLTITATWSDEIGVKHERVEELLVHVVERPPEPVTVRIEEPEVPAGTSTNLTYLIWHNGTDTLQNVQAEVKVDDPLVVADATDVQQLGALKPRSLTRMVVHVISDNEARGIQSTPFTLTWTRADGSTIERTYNLAVPVVGTVDPRVTAASATINNQTFAATIAGTLTNLGNTPALNAYVQVLPGQNYAPTQPQYVGQLAQNTPVPFTIPTTLLNRSVLNATPSGPQTSPGGAPGGGQPPGGGGQIIRPGGGGGGAGGGPIMIGPGGAMGGANRTVGPNTVQLLVTWTDDYGKTKSEVVSIQAPPRAAVPITPRSAGESGATSEGPLGIPGIGSLGIVAVLATAVALGNLSRRRRG